MNYQKQINDTFTKLSMRVPVANDTIVFDGTEWEFNGAEWWAKSLSRVLDSKDFHIRSLEAMLKKACKFNISPRLKHDIIIAREKEKGKPFFYVVNNGSFNRITKDLKSISESRIGVNENDFKERTQFMSLIDAFNVAEKYIEMQDDI